MKPPHAPPSGRSPTPTGPAPRPGETPPGREPRPTDHDFRSPRQVPPPSPFESLAKTVGALLAWKSGRR